MIWLVIFLGVLVLALTLINFKLGRDNEVQEDTIAELQFKLTDSAYFQLEKGMDEQQESFEQEYLQWDDQRTALEEEINGRARVIAEQDERLEWLEEHFGVFKEPKSEEVDDYLDFCAELREKWATSG